MLTTHSHHQQANRPSALSAQASRRRFLKTIAASWATIAIVPGSVLGLRGQISPNNRLALAGIGVGGVGFSQLQECEKAGFQIVALCDVDHAYAKKAFDRWPQARRYRDFREMFVAEGDKIDCVHVGTPDHTHALITLAALRHKKHVCCVKPLTRTLHEARLVVDAARKAGVKTQVTAAPNTTEAACRTCEYIQAGAIGQVREVHIWSNRPVWPQGMTRPKGSDAVPESLDWTLWMGPAPMRPFLDHWPEGHYALTQVKAAGKDGPWYKSVYHPFNFRGWWDFGTGALGDMGCHHFNTPFRALKLSHPKYVQATATRVFEETAPLASVVGYDFEARDGMPPVRLIWYDGGLKPPAPRACGQEPLPEEGVLYVGELGTMLGHEILDEQLALKARTIPRTLPRRGGTWAEWMEACKGGEPAGCHFEWAGLLTESVLLGNIAIRAGKRLEWNAEERRFANSDFANQLVEEKCHNGWSYDTI